MVAIAMWYSPGRYPGWVCSARSASRKAFPWPGLTRKNRLNSLVGPTLTPGRVPPVSVVAIRSSHGPGPRSEAAFHSCRPQPQASTLPAAATTWAFLTWGAPRSHHGLKPGRRPHPMRVISRARLSPWRDSTWSLLAGRCEHRRERPGLPGDRPGGPWNPVVPAAPAGDVVMDGELLGRAS